MTRGTGEDRAVRQTRPSIIACRPAAPAVTENLTNLYSKELRKPAIAVIVKTFAGRRVYVIMISNCQD
jgi:hypothetical protein